MAGEASGFLLAAAGLSLALLAASCASAGPGKAGKPDAVSGASDVSATQPTQAGGEAEPLALIVLESSDTGSTAKIARAIAGPLRARIVSAEQAEREDLRAYRLIGFGSGIFRQRHRQSLFDLIRELRPAAGQRAFVFSTSGVSRQFALEHDTDDTHAPLRDSLALRGFSVIGEFNCAGYNDNSFLRLFGGVNKGRPNVDDLREAESFSAELAKYL